MKTIVGLVCVLALVVAIGAPPVVENNRRAKAPPEPNDSQGSDDVLDQLEYSRYLKEVVEILESDPDFKRKLEKATVEEIKSGDIAEHLNYVQHHVRTRLDEAKQREMARLRDLMQRKVRGLSEKQRKMLARADPQGRRLNEMLPKHVDHANSETFEQGDLERLIRHATKDLDEIDRQREQEFKQYEMRKEYDRRKRLAKLDDEDRRRLEKLHREALEKKKNHRKVNHPGSVDQMEEVWEKVDKLEADQFTPKSFFKLHDINGDGFLDEGEIEAIMLKEAAKIHEEAPEADPVEKEEEMERMRQHVMKEFDKNNDRMLSLAEFELGVNGTGAKNDQGWQSIEDKEVYSNQEFQRFSEQMDPVSTSIPREQTPPTTTVRQQPAVNASVSEPASSSIAPAGQPIRGAAPEVRNA